MRLACVAFAVVVKKPLCDLPYVAIAARKYTKYFSRSDRNVCYVRCGRKKTTLRSYLRSDRREKIH